MSKALVRLPTDEKEAHIQLTRSYSFELEHVFKAHLIYTWVPSASRRTNAVLFLFFTR